MRLALLVLSTAALAISAGIDGTVVNMTTSKPQAGVPVNLVQPGEQGMKNLGIANSGPDGTFHFDQDPKGAALLQAVYQGVTYTLVLGPGQPRTGVSVNVFNTSKRQEIAKIEQHMVILEPAAERLQVTETFLVKNDSNETLSDPAAGSLRIFLPEGAGPARVMIQSGMIPVQRPAVETRQKGIYKVDYPVKPGETRFDISYSMPPTQTFAGRTTYKNAPTRIVTPSAVTLAGEGIKALGQEPTTKAHIYDVTAADYKVSIEGTGAIRGTEPAGDSGAAAGGGEGPQIHQIRPKLYERLYWVLGLTFAILGLGFALLYRRGGAAK